MEKKVVVLTPNGRRQTVKVTPNTTLLMVLEEACLKHDFNSEEYVLRHHNKEVDLTQMFRFSGLPNHCCLEMWQAEKKRVESSVDICIVLEDGSRQQDQFVPSDSLWHVIEKLCPNFALAAISPVAVYMREELIGRDNLTKTSLKSLGITSGRAMIRFFDKQPQELKLVHIVSPKVAEPETTESKDTQMKPTELKTAEHKVIEPPFSHSEAAESQAAKTKPNISSASGGFILTKELLKSIKKPNSPSGITDESAHGATERMEISAEDTSGRSDNVTAHKYNWDTGKGRKICDTCTDASENTNVNHDAERLSGMKTEPEVHIIGERNAIVYSLDSTQIQIEDLPDSFYDLTVNDLKLVLHDLKKISASNEEMPLLTEKLRLLEENRKKLKMAKYANCAIRIKFPDGYVLQGIFKPEEKLTNIMDFIRKFIEQPEREFYLFTIPPKTVLPSDKTLMDLNLVPSAVIYFCFSASQQSEIQRNTVYLESERKIIRAEFLQKLSTERGAFYASNKFRTPNGRQENLNTAPKSPTTSTGAIPKRPRNDDKRD